jgi:hypothetical protein
MTAPQTFTIPATVLEVGGSQDVYVTLAPPAPVPAFRVRCNREMAVTLAAHLYRWIDVTFDGGKVLTIAPRKEAS